MSGQNQSRNTLTNSSFQNRVKSTVNKKASYLEQILRFEQNPRQFRNSSIHNFRQTNHPVQVEVVNVEKWLSVLVIPGGVPLLRYVFFLFLYIFLLICFLQFPLSLRKLFLRFLFPCFSVLFLYIHIHSLGDLHSFKDFLIFSF